MDLIFLPYPTLYGSSKQKTSRSSTLIQAWISTTSLSSTSMFFKEDHLRMSKSCCSTSCPPVFCLVPRSASQCGRWTLWWTPPVSSWGSVFPRTACLCPPSSRPFTTLYHTCPQAARWHRSTAKCLEVGATKAYAYTHSLTHALTHSLTHSLTH